MAVNTGIHSRDQQEISKQSAELSMLSLSFVFLSLSFGLPFLPITFVNTAYDVKKDYKSTPVFEVKLYLVFLIA